MQTSNILSDLEHPDLEHLEEKLSAFFSKENSVILAYLFGSIARGEAYCLSDIDIAVLFDKNLTKKECLTFS